MCVCVKTVLKRRKYIFHYVIIVDQVLFTTKWSNTRATVDNPLNPTPQGNSEEYYSWEYKFDVNKYQLYSIIILIK